MGKLCHLFLKSCHHYVSHIVFRFSLMELLLLDIRQPSYLISSDPISSYLISSYPISSYHISSYHISSYHISSYPISSHPISSHHILSNPILSYLILSYPISSHLFSSSLLKIALKGNVLEPRRLQDSIAELKKFNAKRRLKASCRAV